MTLEQLNKRIQTTTDLRNIVSTMKMLSSVSVLQFTNAENGLKSYTKTLLDGFKALATHKALKSPPPPPNQKALLLLIGADNGLVGSFNKGILSTAQKYMQKNGLNKEKTPCICLGRRLCAMAQYENLHLTHSFPMPNNPEEIANNASTLIRLIQEIVLEEKIGKVIVFFNQKEKETNRIHQQQLMPFHLPHIDLTQKKIWAGRSFPMLSVSTVDFFHALIHEYIVISLAQSIISSLACEHFIRMIHMQQAEKNIDETLEKINLIYAQERQTNITNELIDIVSGATSIKKKKKTVFRS